MSRDIILGIDTSNYTTSVAAVATDGELVANIKLPLPVKPGERGLRQSDAVFAHVKNIPEAMDRLHDFIQDGAVRAVGVSSRPRNVDGSYMPCFLSGVAAAKSIATTNGIRLYSFSHQCGHIMSALYSSGATELCDFAAFHVSGGTTELLSVSRAEGGFRTELVGGTKDLNAGQIIDRIGVHMGLPFPAGPRLEALALSGARFERKKPSVTGTYANLSGLENMALKLYRDTGDKAAVAGFVFDYIGMAIVGMCRGYCDSYGERPFVFAGGVMCNSIIKEMLKGEFTEAYFAEPALSSDNAVGIAALARESLLKDC